MDVHDSATRSYNMSRIKCKDTKPEEVVRKFLFSQGFRYRKNDPKLPGKPDIVLSKYRAVVFVNGCFWHHHKDCKSFKWPATNADFWKEKIERNVKRDEEIQEKLRNAGWNVIVVWECKLKTNREATLYELSRRIQNV